LRIQSRRAEHWFAGREAGKPRQMWVMRQANAAMHLYFDADFLLRMCKSYRACSMIELPDQLLCNTLRRVGDLKTWPPDCMVQTVYNNKVVRSVQKEARPGNRRVYVNQRIRRLRDEVKGLRDEMRDAQSASQIYARERLVILRDELKSLTAERKSFPQKPAGAQKSASAAN
jgi:hypothetical protein